MKRLASRLPAGLQPPADATTQQHRKGHRVLDPTAAVVRFPKRSSEARSSAAGSFLWNLPRNILILLLMAYRKVISPLYGQVCRFFPVLLGLCA